MCKVCDIEWMLYTWNCTTLALYSQFSSGHRFNLVCICVWICVCVGLHACVCICVCVWSHQHSHCKQHCVNNSTCQLHMHCLPSVSVCVHVGAYIVCVCVCVYLHVWSHNVDATGCIVSTVLPVKSTYTARRPSVSSVSSSGPGVEDVQPPLSLHPDPVTLSAPVLDRQSPQQGQSADSPHLYTPVYISGCLLDFVGFCLGNFQEKSKQLLSNLLYCTVLMIRIFIVILCVLWFTLSSFCAFKTWACVCACMLACNVCVQCSALCCMFAFS